GVMTDVLVVPTLQFGDPVPFLVLVEARDLTFHRNSPRSLSVQVPRLLGLVLGKRPAVAIAPITLPSRSLTTEKARLTYSLCPALGVARVFMAPVPCFVCPEATTFPKPSQWACLRCSGTMMSKVRPTASSGR